MRQGSALNKLGRIDAKSAKKVCFVLHGPRRVANLTISYPSYQLHPEDSGRFCGFAGWLDPCQPGTRGTFPDAIGREAVAPETRPYRHARKGYEGRSSGQIRLLGHCLSRRSIPSSPLRRSKTKSWDTYAMLTKPILSPA